MPSIHFKPLAIAIAAASLAWVAPGEARVTRIVIDRTADLANPFDATKPYQLLSGRAFGELDPFGRHNELLTDLRLAPRNANGKVEYVASFVIRKPKDDSAISGVMWHDVPNRGRDVNFPRDSFAAKTCISSRAGRVTTPERRPFRRGRIACPRRCPRVRPRRRGSPIM